MTDATTPPPLGHLPIQQWGYYNCPAIPFWALADGTPDPQHLIDTLKQLGERGTDQTASEAYAGLTTTYSIGGNSKVEAYEAMYGSLPAGEKPNLANPLANVSVGVANQFSLAWTNDGNVYQGSQYLRGPFADTLKDKDVATREFWPTIANFGIPYNLLLLAKVTKARVDELRAEFGNVWKSEDMETAYKTGRAYVIDTRIIEVVQPYSPVTEGVPLAPRFAPGCLTLLKQDGTTKELEPVAVKLSTAGASANTHVYVKGGGQWLYALQAAKASITVWGIWLGHVAHWHIPTAAMQMTMFNELPTGHPLRTFLDPMSKWLIDFDFALLQGPNDFFEQISPPTPVAGPMPLLDLIDRFAAGRKFFDLDPLTELANQGIDKAAFTRTDDWDVYPLAGYLTTIYGICERFASVVVDQLYVDDQAVRNDTDLKNWIDASNDPANGNVKLGQITTKPLLNQLLTSLLYRVTAHAAGSLTSVVNPTLAFVSNFPPCLQSANMPKPTDQELTEAELIEHLPYTGTIGTMATFYFTFAYTTPYVPAIPTGGENLDLYWPDSPGTAADAACNAALVKYRQDISSFVTTYTDNWNAELARIGGVPVGPIPGYANPVTQVQQWPRSIEI